MTLLFVTFWGFYSECPEEMFYWKPVSLIHPVIHLCESFFLNTKQSKSKFSKLFFQEGFLELQFLYLPYSLIFVFLFRDFNYTYLVTSLLINYIGYFPSSCFTLVFYFFWIFNFFPLFDFRFLLRYYLLCAFTFYLPYFTWSFLKWLLYFLLSHEFYYPISHILHL